jgi:hypothetical protein
MDPSIQQKNMNTKKNHDINKQYKNCTNLLQLKTTTHYHYKGLRQPPHDTASARESWTSVFCSTCSIKINWPLTKRSKVTVFLFWYGTLHHVLMHICWVEANLYNFYIVCLCHDFFLCSCFSVEWRDPSWSWSYDRCILGYLCNQCLSPLSCEFESHPCWDVLNTTLCDKVCQWLATGQWFSLGTVDVCFYQ